MAGYDRLYYLRKAWPLFPGIVRPIAAPFLAPHYESRRAGRGPLRAALDAVIGLGFHLWIPWRAATVQRRFGFDDAWRRRAITIARARFVDPNDIALFRIERPDDLDRYVRRFEDAAINKRINPLGWTSGCALTDKRRFAERCRAAGLPCPETVATVIDGTIAVLADPADRPLVVKPIRGEGGDGLHLLGPVADGPALAARLRDVTQDCLVQPLIVVHPALADIALGALPTVRIVTMLDEAGMPELVSATFRCAADPCARVDNMKAGGLIVPVALEDGRLGRACFGYGGVDHDIHPASGAQIAGRTLPDWAGAAALVTRAHAGVFADYILIGWDVAFTADGPILIEGNGKPGVLMPQRAARRGLGEGRYGALLAHHLATKS
ncbi:MAG: sugar-transfer associated ATP-grasp domain-containing protein [Pseudomonadota bacterium]